MKSITVFTTTYNRANLLPRLYKSLCNQTNKNFLWLIVDDGSTDNTKYLIDQWIKEKIIEIHYHYKENGGMHTGHNLAYSLITTELNICIDSDDYMPDNAIYHILDKWANTKDNSRLAGLVGLDATISGEIIGTKLPEIEKDGFLEIYEKYKCVGDKKVVLNTEILRKFPLYPIFEGERLVPLGSLYIKIGAEYDFVYDNTVYCIVDYQPSGSSNTIFKQYKQSPRGFAYARKCNNEITRKNSMLFKNALHIGSSAIFTKDWKILIEDKRTIVNLLVFPLSIMLNIYIRTKIRNN